MPVTSPVKVTDAGDESNLEEVCKAVISYFSYDFLKPIDISLCPKAFLTPILISTYLMGFIHIRRKKFNFNNGVCNTGTRYCYSSVK